MTASISIATRKPRSKRSAKVLILTGADGKYVRRDGRCEEHLSVHTRKPDLDAGSAIIDSVEGEPIPYVDYSPDYRRPRNPRRSPHTSESPGFICKPTQRRKVKRKDLIKVVVSQIPEPPQFDEAGRPIVYKTDDAWNHRCFR